MGIFKVAFLTSVFFFNISWGLEKIEEKINKLSITASRLKKENDAAKVRQEKIEKHLTIVAKKLNLIKTYTFSSLDNNLRTAALQCVLKELLMPDSDNFFVSSFARRIMSLISLKKIKTIAAGEARQALFSPNGEILVVQGTEDIPLDSSSEEDEVEENDCMYVFDSSNFNLIEKIESYSACSIFTRDGTDLVRVGRYEFNKVSMKDYRCTRFALVNKDPLSLSLSSDQKLLAASAFMSKKVYLWDFITREPTELKGHEGFVQTVVFSPLSKMIASASNDCTIKLWDTTTYCLITTLKGHKGSVNCLAFSPNGKMIASGSTDSMVNVWNTATYELIDVLNGYIHPKIGHKLAVVEVLFSPDGKMLASSSNDGTVRLWNSENKSLLATINTSKRYPNMHVLAFSPNGKQLVTGGDKGINIWDLQIYYEVPQFLLTLYANTAGVKKFLMLNGLLEDYEKIKKKVKLDESEARALIAELPAWLQQALLDKLILS